MANTGITHRDSKGVQTKIQELQLSYGKASDYLRNTVSGVTDHDVANGAKNINAVLAKIFRYWDKLDPIMSQQTCLNPPVTNESTAVDIPNLLQQPTATETNLKEAKPMPPGSAPHTSCPQALSSEHEEEGLAITSATLDSSTTTATPKAHRTGDLKRKSPSKSLEPLGLDQILAESSKYRTKLLESCEFCDANKLATNHKRAKMAAKKDKKLLALEDWKLQVVEMEVQMKVRKAEMEEIQAWITIMSELQKLGQKPEEIKRYLAQQFVQGPQLQGTSGGQDDKLSNKLDFESSDSSSSDSFNSNG